MSWSKSFHGLLRGQGLYKIRTSINRKVSLGRRGGSLGRWSETDIHQGNLYFSGHKCYWYGNR